MAWRATMASSIVGVPPRLLTSRTARSPAARRHGVEDRAEQAVDEGVGRLQRSAPDARLAVDAQAQLDLVVAEREARAADGRDRAGAQRHAHRGHRRGRGAGLGGDLGEAQPRLGRGAGDLVDEDRPGQAAPAGMLGRRAQRDVVGDDDELDRDALGPGQLGGEARSSGGRRCSS
jgi:hypothetical protein